MTRNRLTELLIPVCLAALSALILAGCVPNHVDENKENQTIEQGRPLLEAYIKSVSEEAEPDRVFMPGAAKVGNTFYMGQYRCNVVGAEFQVDGRYYEAYVDLETDRIWTNYGMFDVDEQVARQMEAYFDRYNYSTDFTVTGARMEVQIISHDIESGKKNERVDTYVILEDMIPADLPGETAAEQADACLTNAALSSFDIYYAKNSEDEPMPLTILSDYLTESGNYVTTEPDSGGFYLYTLYGLTGEALDAYRQSGELPEIEKLAGFWTTYLHLTDSPETMGYTEQQSGLYEQDGFIVRYHPIEKNGTVQTYETDSFIHCECPVVIRDNILRFDDDTGEHPTLYFYGEPEFSKILATTFDGGKENAAKELHVIDLGDGLYSITDGTYANRGAYSFSRRQWIRFEGKASAAGTGFDGGIQSDTGESRIRIKYHNPMPLVRQPRFENKQDVITMQLNGHDWYTVRIISADEKEIMYNDLVFVTESSNMKVYDNGMKPSSMGGEEQSYLYFFDPGDPAGSLILFETLADPHFAGGADDFTANIQYFVGQTEAFPDIPKLP